MLWADGAVLCEANINHTRSPIKYNCYIFEHLTSTEIL
jgi:hypothetical protein